MQVCVGSLRSCDAHESYCKPQQCTKCLPYILVTGRKDYMSFASLNGHLSGECDELQKWKTETLAACTVWRETESRDRTTGNTRRRYGRLMKHRGLDQIICSCCLKLSGTAQVFWWPIFAQLSSSCEQFQKSRLCKKCDDLITII